MALQKDLQVIMTNRAQGFGFCIPVIQWNEMLQDDL